MKVYFNSKKHDFPKKTGDLQLAWYQNGKICICRRTVERQLQKQNIQIILINQLSKRIWDQLNHHFKKDLVIYAKCYKKKYPGLRKRGISAYSAFLMIVHALIRRFQIQCEDSNKGFYILHTLIKAITVKDAIRVKLLKAIPEAYKLNKLPENDQSDLFETPENIKNSDKYFRTEVRQKTWFYP